MLLDTNGVIAEDFGRGRVLEVLLERCKQGHLRLIVPELVLAETEAKHRERLQQLLSRWTRDGAELRRLGLGLPAASPAIDVNACAAREARELRGRLLDAGAELPPLPACGHEPLVERAISRRRPFDAHGHGYRDALLWQTLLDVCGDDDLVLVSADERAFAAEKSPDDLHPMLCAEAERRTGRPDPVRLARSVAQALSRLDELTARVLKRFERDLFANAETLAEVMHAVAEAAEDFGVHIPLPASASPAVVAQSRVDHANEFVDVAVLSAVPLANRSVSAEIRVGMGAALRVWADEESGDPWPLHELGFGCEGYGLLDWYLQFTVEKTIEVDARAVFSEDVQVFEGLTLLDCRLRTPPETHPGQTRLDKVA